MFVSINTTLALRAVTGQNTTLSQCERLADAIGRTPDSIDKNYIKQAVANYNSFTPCNLKNFK